MSWKKHILGTEIVNSITNLNKRNVVLFNYQCLMYVGRKEEAEKILTYLDHDEWLVINFFSEENNPKTEDYRWAGGKPFWHCNLHLTDEKARAENRKHFKDIILPELFTEVDYDIPSYCRTREVLAIAKNIYDNQDWTSLGVLADALEDTGLENQLVLQHLRREGGHMLGCHVMEALLYDIPSG